MFFQWTPLVFSHRLTQSHPPHHLHPPSTHPHVTCRCVAERERERERSSKRRRASGCVVYAVSTQQEWSAPVQLQPAPAQLRPPAPTNPHAQAQQAQAEESSEECCGFVQSTHSLLFVVATCLRWCGKHGLASGALRTDGRAAAAPHRVRGGPHSRSAVPTAARSL
jgi:hypothetical protein